jgi:hypothetical protein
LKAITKATAPNMMRVKSVTGKKFNLSIYFRLKQKKVARITPIVPPIKEEGISFVGVRKCPICENKRIEIPVMKDKLTNIFIPLFFMIEASITFELKFGANARGGADWGYLCKIT